MYPVDPLEQVHRIYGELLKEAGIMPAPSAVSKLTSLGSKLPGLGAGTKATAMAGKPLGAAMAAPKPLAPPGATGVPSVNINR